MKVEHVALALENALMRHAGVTGRVENLVRLSGGATKLTWAFDLISEKGRQALILQQTSTPEESGPARPAAGADARKTPKLSAEEDASVMISAAMNGVQTPEVICVLSPEDGLDDGYVTVRVDGETLGKRITRDASFAPARRLLAGQCGVALARIHATPTTNLGFLQTLTPAQELSLYGGVIDDMELGHPAFEYALRWVRENLPQTSRQTLTHADFRTGNLIVDPDTGLRCILDWEIARIGDPVQDFGVLCMRTWRFGGEGHVGGFGSRDDLFGAYENSGGAPVDPKHVRFWEAFANLKWAISCVRRGTARTQDGRPAGVELCAIGRRMEEPLWDFFELVESAA